MINKIQELKEGMKTEYKSLQRTEALDVISRFIDKRKLRKWTVVNMGNNIFRIKNEIRGVYREFDMNTRRFTI